MEDNKVTIYRLNNSPIEVDSDEVAWVDHSRMLDGLCPRKRYIRYHHDGMGVVGTGRNDDLGIGGTIHEGLDLLFQGGQLDKALEVARDYYEALPPWPSYMLPEQVEVLSADHMHLSWAFIYAFNYAYLPQIMEEYEVLEVEEEINWLLTDIDPSVFGKKYLVMMSRPDGVLKHRKTNQLWHMSHKSYNGIFNDLKIMQLDTDSQRMAECLAIMAKYGDKPEGSIYNYFLKGRKSNDERYGVERYTNGLIRPYMQRQTPGGEILPEFLSFNYEWDELDMTTHMIKTRRLGKGWERVAIYNEMDFWTYLDWLQHSYIKPPGAAVGRDHLAESVAGNVPVYFNLDHALRWASGQAIKEIQWVNHLYAVEGGSLDDPNDNSFNYEFPLEQSQCFSYNRPCSYHPICWKGVPITHLLETGALLPRDPNHIQEGE